MKKMITALKIILITLLSFILLLNVCIMIKTKSNPDKIPSIFGYKPFVVLSGSMESEFNIGDLIFVKETNISDLKVNDIIAFKDNDNFVTTHRIIKEIKINDKKCFRTKGDSNTAVDEGTVCEKQLEGKYQGKIAKIGNFILFIQKPLGFMVLMLLILIICIFIYFLSSTNINKMSEEELREFEEYKRNKLLKKQQRKTTRNVKKRTTKSKTDN